MTKNKTKKKKKRKKKTITNHSLNWNIYSDSGSGSKRQLSRSSPTNRRSFPPTRRNQRWATCWVLAPGRWRRSYRSRHTRHPTPWHRPMWRRRWRWRPARDCCACLPATPSAEEISQHFLSWSTNLGLCFSNCLAGVMWKYTNILLLHYTVV